MEARATKVQSFDKVLEVLGETPVASEPEEDTLDHQRGGRTAKPFCRRRLDYLHAQPQYLGTAVSTCHSL
jgi:hypothetical protein